MVSPTTPGPANARRVDRLHALDSAPNSAPFVGHGDIPEALSRRESVDSRINQGFGDMRLGNSPYASHNPSTTSIQNTLQQQRNPRANFETLAVHRISNGYQPSAERNPDGLAKNVKTAPAITGPAISQIARAAEPTKGQAWAFPEEEIHRLPSSGRNSLVESRRSSIADSLASSQFTTESRLPPGQRRLDDGLSAAEFQRLSNASGDFPAVHHHSLQHKQLGTVHSEDSASQAGSQPYSRTPELRVSHKLAERKRRTEMKELFEQLRDLMPQERGSKASKWEILTKGSAPVLGRLLTKSSGQTNTLHQRLPNTSVNVMPPGTIKTRLVPSRERSSICGENSTTFGWRISSYATTLPAPSTASSPGSHRSQCRRIRTLPNSLEGPRRGQSYRRFGLFRMGFPALTRII